MTLMEDSNERKIKAKQIHQNFLDQRQKIKNFVGLFRIMEVFSIMMLFFNIFLFQCLLGKDIFYYGYNLVLFLMNKTTSDPRELIFPRFTKCNFMHHAFSGDLTVSDHSGDRYSI